MAWRLSVISLAVLLVPAGTVAQPRVTIDPPAVSPASPLTISGVAVDPRATPEPGIAEVQIWALADHASDGVFLGNATLGIDRRGGDAHTPAIGYLLEVPDGLLASGSYQVQVTARSTIDGATASATRSLSLPGASSTPPGLLDRDALARASGMPACDPPPSQTTGTRWRIHRIVVPAVPSLFAYLVICNASSFPAQVVLQVFRTEDRASARRAYTIPARSQHNLSLAPELSYFFSTPGGPESARTIGLEVTSRSTRDGTARLVVETATGNGLPRPTGANTLAECFADCRP